VQFPHPGVECRSRTDDVPWNTGPAHRRKFLVGAGRFVDVDERVGEAELVLWGEWEPPSQIERRWPVSGRLPRALHRPYWTTPLTPGFRHNTDPWVSGERMLYSNCRQTRMQPRRSNAAPRRVPTSMQELQRGSVICFGSRIAGEFCLDTVFVVASKERWSADADGELNVGDAFLTCTARPIAQTAASGCGCGSGSTATGCAVEANAELTLFRGATYDDPVDGMFSFVPARLASEEDPRFARPPIRIAGLINPASWRGPSGATRPLDIATIRNSWQSLKEQVATAGLVLGVSLDTPTRRVSPGQGGNPM
jgi:hypothetical protein